MALLPRLGQTMLAQRGHLICWLPVAMACGIGLFFGLRFEPSAALIAAACAAVPLGMLLARWWGEAWGPLAVFLSMMALGFVLAAWRAHGVAGPVLDWRYYGPVEGRIVALDRSASDAVRITLDRVKLDRVAPADTPARVRISLHGDDGLGIVPQPGLRIMTTGHLAPPGGPVEPGGFDFQRHAWFKQLGAVGYTRVPVLAIAPARADLPQRVFRLRMALSAAVRDRLPGDVGGFAAAVTTGDRSGIGQEALDDLRASNTAHLLAISGLHMGLLSGFVFGLLRLLLALIPGVALRMPTRKIAAGGALGAAAVYLALSGGNVATERAFVMVAVALVAVMLNRRALSLRAVAVAAMIVLALRPEALMGPGFQMSFAATTALVAVFGWLRDGAVPLGPRWARPAVALVISSAVAGLATAPFGAAHFNAVAQYGLLANLTSVPLMGVVVIPGSVLALVLAPFGLEVVGLTLMGGGLQWILWVADWVASLDGARRYVPGPAPFVLPMMVLGALVVILWQGRSRLLGVPVMIWALVAWQWGERPQVLIADTGTLVGQMTRDGRALSRAKGAGFIAQNWLENDGDGADQETAAGRWPQDAMLVRHVRGKKARQGFAGCAPGSIVVADGEVPGPARDCLLLTPDLLRQTGAVALVGRDGALRIVTARDRTGDRMWSGWARYPRPMLDKQVSDRQVMTGRDLPRGSANRPGDKSPYPPRLPATAKRIQ